MSDLFSGLSNIVTVQSCLLYSVVSLTKLPDILQSA